MHGQPERAEGERQHEDHDQCGAHDASLEKGLDIGVVGTERRCAVWTDDERAEHGDPRHPVHDPAPAEERVLLPQGEHLHPDLPPTGHIGTAPEQGGQLRVPADRNSD